LKALEKPCSTSIEGGFDMMMCGEDVKICSTILKKIEESHIRGAVKKSKTCWMLGKSALRQERSGRPRMRCLVYGKGGLFFGICRTGKF
jgi:hypothetical protein